MSVLKGPADADHFRVKVGRYGDRWYTDPLDRCDIAEATDWHGPSVSATKPPFANKYVPMRSIADMPSDEWQRLAGKPADDRYEAIKTHDKLTSRTNMDRGSIVHLWAEDLLFGRPVERKLIKGSKAALEQAERFLPALESFFNTHQPELVACEVVCLHRTLNGVGYGGTSDAYIRIEGDIWCVDWKSRNSDHDAYADEAGQGGAYIGAEYMIIQGPDGNPMRVELPKVAGVLIVSIREDGFRAYPIDAVGAIKHYEAMHAWWCAQQDLARNKVIGRPWAPKVAAPVGSPDGEQPSTGEPVPSPVDRDSASTRPPDDREVPDGLTSVPGAGQSNADGAAVATISRRATLKSRYDLLNDEQKADYTARKQAIDTNDLDAVEKLLDEVEPFNRVAASRATCDSCKAPIYWAVTEKGHAMPIDVASVDDGNIHVDDNGIARVVGHTTLDDPRPLHLSHFVTCPNADQHRTKRKKAPPDEGPDIDDATIAALQREFERLSDEAKFWIASLTAQGRKAGVDWRPNALPTVRRYELSRGIVRLAKEMA